ncbi:MAG: DHH family phosphoesterase [Solobacterium sp.]|jgi:single-stranded-DNA-specific exonuclease|nr:DHH family phosphoesterase [Solobacterium sp.]MCH4205517.1 DHH family phosphoesterase [Solobacterium sp.]MCH4227041.1 DHH family phosphoesterase [Solobacterium sp.]MCH4282204.1 DHH family phosphoesterase [Solobacterium sp.]
MRWQIIHADPRKYETAYQVLSLSGKLMAAAHLSDAQIQELLSSDTRLTSSQAICVMQACARIKQAKENNEKVFIAGDYDGDGVCSTAIMKATLDAMGIVNGFYIPDRIKEGYGLKPATVKAAAEKGYSLIITVDNGVKAQEALQLARSLKIDTIVTDHHIIEEDVPADILVHPSLMEDAYQYLSGAGVALEISRNLIGNRDDLNAFAGTASITDVMPLWKETRKLVNCALDQLKVGQPRSLAALLQPNSTIDDTAIGFYIGPKLNSVGRMSDTANVNTLPTFLLSRNDRLIADYAAQLQQVNELRKQRALHETETAEKMVAEQAFLLIYDPHFHEGICGQIAGNLADKYKRPALVMAKSGDLVKGSGRSVPGFDLYEFFHDFKGLSAFGGHAQAVGISVPYAEFASFRQQIQNKMAAHAFVYQEPAETAIEVSCDEITFDALADLQRLAPYPHDLMKPFFAVDHPEIIEIRDTAKMVKYRIANASGGFDAVLYKRRNIAALKRPITLIGTLGINRWQGKVTCQMVIEDMQ